MDTVAPAIRPVISPAVLDRTALVAALLTPLFLMHGHAVAEVTIGIVDGCFLARCAVTRSWGWLRRGWVPLGLAWWLWLVVCSLAFPALDLGKGGYASTVQALATLRFLLFTAALEHLVLCEPPARRWMAGILAACATYITAQALLQFATGHNLYGNGRGIAGELTGPFDKPRAGPPLARILLPVVIPPAAALLARREAAASLAAYVLLLGAACLMVLMNQRMPAVLTGLGLVVSALLLRRLRPVVLVALVAGCALVAASAMISPPTWQRLVVQFSSQLENFGASQYGFLFQRSVAMAEQHPWTGRGYDGFRTGCPLPRYGEAALEAAQAHFGVREVCAPHPHNFYLQALTDGGVPGLILFCALALAWTIPLGRGLWRDPAPVRVGLFASALIQLWPVASTSSFFSMPMGGWFFLLLGWGLAESRAVRGSGDRPAAVPLQRPRISSTVT